MQFYYDLKTKAFCLLVFYDIHICLSQTIEKFMKVQMYMCIYVYVYVYVYM